MDDFTRLVVYLLLWFGILALFFWLVIRPQKRRAARHKELVESLGRGDRVVTAGGIHGEIVALQEQTITLEVAKGVQIRLDRRGVRRKYGDEEGAE
jgi:preprotein translocase subunit YajC